MDEASISTAGAIDTFLVLLIGIGPKLAFVPFLEITGSLDDATKRRVHRKMLVTAATVALALIVPSSRWPCPTCSIRSASSA